MQSPLKLWPLSPRRQITIVLLLAATVFAVYCFRIGAPEFTNASEKVVTVAALESRRGGSWWVPTMHGRPRILKPPVPTWITASAMSPETVAATQAGGIAERDSAYHDLATQARRPSALAVAGIVTGTWALASIVADGGVGLLAAVICAGTVLLFRFGRQANTDVHLTLWVVMANTALAMALVRGQWWRGCLGAGLSLGLAMMCKGPVGLLQSVLPAVAIALYQRRTQSVDEPRRPVNWRAVGAGMLVLLATALPWYIAVVATVPNAVHQWIIDVFAAPGTEDRKGHWWDYVNLLPNLLPWTPLFVAGLVFPAFRRLRSPGVIYAWLLFVVPIVLMSMVRDKNERYGLPLVPAAAVLCAIVVSHFARNRIGMTWSDRAVEHIHWIMAFGLAAAPVIGAIPIGGNPPRYSWATAVVASACCLAVIAAARILWKRIPWTIVAGPAVVSLVVCHCAVYAFSTLPQGMSEFKPMAYRLAMQYPDAQIIFDEGDTGRHTPTDLAIYASRIIVSADRVDLAGPAAQEQILVAIRSANSDPIPRPGWTLLSEEGIENRPCSVYHRKP